MYCCVFCFLLLRDTLCVCVLCAQRGETECAQYVRRVHVLQPVRSMLQWEIRTLYTVNFDWLTEVRMEYAHFPIFVSFKNR